MQCGKRVSKSTILLRSIGIPNVQKPVFAFDSLDNLPNLLQCAKNNKIPLLFLRSVASDLEKIPFASALLKYEQQYQSTTNLIEFVGDLLENVDYTFFKTIKPFPYVPSDVDILFRSIDDLLVVEKKLKNKNCVSLERDEYGVTMFSKTHKLCIDLTTKIAVSGMVYVANNLIFEHVQDYDFHGTEVRTLEQPADLLVAIGHSIFKEQMYTLSDYYTLVLLAHEWKKALKLAEKFHLKHATETVLGVTKDITLNAFGSLDAISQKPVRKHVCASTKGCGKDIELPKKYDLSTLIVELSKKVTSDPVTLTSLLVTAKTFCSPSFYRKAVEHITRDAY